MDDNAHEAYFMLLSIFYVLVCICVCICTAYLLCMYMYMCHMSIEMFLSLSVSMCVISRGLCAAPGSVVWCGVVWCGVGSSGISRPSATRLCCSPLKRTQLASTSLLPRRSHHTNSYTTNQPPQPPLSEKYIKLSALRNRSENLESWLSINNSTDSTHCLTVSLSSHFQLLGSGLFCARGT